MTVTIQGQKITRHPLAGACEFTKTATVLAAQTMDEGLVMTPEGAMSYGPGDYIVSDNPPTHCWPVKREVFESTYELVEVLQDEEIMRR